MLAKKKKIINYTLYTVNAPPKAPEKKDQPKAQVI